MLRKDRVANGEQRWQAIGAVDSAVLLVAYVYRRESDDDKEEIIRIIPARAADKRERRIYLQQAIS